MAFVIDLAFFAIICLLEAAAVALFRDMFVSTARGWVGMFLVAVVVNAAFQATFASISGGRSVGRALTSTAIQHQDGRPIGQTPADLVKLFLRFSIGYLIFDVLLTATAWCLWDTRRRCPHDLVLRTQVASVNPLPGGSKARLKDLWDDVEAGLEILRGEWGMLYKLVRLSCLILFVITGAFGLLASSAGLLGTASAASGTTVAAGSSTSGIGVALITAAGTTAATVGLATTGVVLAAENRGGSDLASASLAFTFDGDERLLDEAEGRLGILRGGARVVEWRPGDRALLLDGTGWMEISGGSFAQSGSVTAAAWVKLTEANTWSAILSRWSGRDGVGYWLGGSNPSGGYEWWIDQTRAGDSSEMQLGTWQHVAGTYDAETGRLSLYLNGQTTDQATHPENSPAAKGNLDIRIGSGLGDDNSNTWIGWIDNVGVWEDALSAQKVCQLAGGDLRDGKCRAASRK